MNIFLFSILSTTLFYATFSKKHVEIVQGEVDGAVFDKSIVRHGFFNSYKLNKTTYLNISFQLASTVRDVFASALKMVRGDYRWKVIDLSTLMKTNLQTPLYGTDVLFREYCKPPLMWPLKINVYYYCNNWQPDLSSYPVAIFPEGKWKASIRLGHRNKSLIVEVNTYFTIVHAD